MYRRLTYFLEDRLKSLQARPAALDSDSPLLIYQASTPDHLAICLEYLLTLQPERSVMVVAAEPDALEQMIPELSHLQEKHRLSVALPGSEWPEGVQQALVLLSPKAVAPAAVLHAFQKARAQEIYCIEGNGGIWKADRASRAARRGILRLLRFLSPRRDAEEHRAFHARILPEPAVNLSLDILPCRHKKRRTLCHVPARIEQCEQCGTAIKPDLITGRLPEHLYQGTYHAVPVYDERRDWQADLQGYQQRRLENMAHCGIVLQAGMRSLDVGCGAGGLVAALADKGLTAQGIDLSEASIEKARRDFPQGRFEVARLEDLAGWNARYDLITLSHVLEHARDDAALLLSLIALLAPDGALYIEVPWFSPETLAPRPEWHRQMDHCREYTRPGLRALVEGCGYAVVAQGESWTVRSCEPFQFLHARLRT